MLWTGEASYCRQPDWLYLQNVSEGWNVVQPCVLCLAISRCRDIPPQYLLNRWLKNAEKILIATDGQVSYNQNDRKNMKITDIWYEFNTCLSLAGMDEDLTEQVYSTIKELKEKLASTEMNTKSSKKDFLSSVIGSQPSEVNVLPPKNSRNKGCGKRMLSSIEVSENDKKRQRMCKLCGLMCNHDSRNCPSKA